MSIQVVSFVLLLVALWLFATTWVWAILTRHPLHSLGFTAGVALSVAGYLFMVMWPRLDHDIAVNPLGTAIVWFGLIGLEAAFVYGTISRLVSYFRDGDPLY